MRRRTLLASSTLLPVPALLTGCTRSLRLGLLNTFSGPLSNAGAILRDGVLLAVERYRGILPITVLEYDDQNDVSTLPVLAERMAADGIDAVIGPATSTLSLHWLEHAQRLQLPTVSSTATSDRLSRRDDWFFRVCSTTVNDATQAAYFIRRSKQPQRVSIIYSSENTAFTESWAHQFIQTMKLDERIVTSSHTYDPTHKITSKSINTILEKVRVFQPDVIAIVGTTADVVRVAHLTRRWPSRPTLMTSDWPTADLLFQWGGLAVEGMLMVHDFDPGSTNPLFLEFKERFIEAYARQPNGDHVRAYDAARMLVSAHQQRLTGETLRDTLLRVRRFPGLQAPIELDSWGDCARPVYISELRNQSLQRLT